MEKLEEAFTDCRKVITSYQGSNDSKHCYFVVVVVVVVFLLLLSIRFLYACKAIYVKR